MYVAPQKEGQLKELSSSETGDLTIIDSSKGFVVGSRVECGGDGGGGAPLKEGRLSKPSSSETGALTIFESSKGFVVGARVVFPLTGTPTLLGIQPVLGGAESKGGIDAP